MIKKEFFNKFKVIPIPKDFSPKALYILISTSFLIRDLILFTSQGTNDIYFWESNAKLISAKGLIEAYKTPGSFNHPPLPTLYAKWVYNLVDGNLLSFSKLIKLL